MTSGSGNLLNIYMFNDLLTNNDCNDSVMLIIYCSYFQERKPKMQKRLVKLSSSLIIYEFDAPRNIKNFVCNYLLHIKIVLLPTYIVYYKIVLLICAHEKV